ncbi:C40 family peptidase [Streptomyces sp. RB6PN25]|uniref:C40 family peptidase n=1 Tax=Streptomyces humicola TaxID=2953240 RepID=A0ABT1PXH9_9ACTN|nr:C40 family peptidase [Streptomyces humicola]MCQ4081262.1 C40 family peptidase [Streptomyces humicola]
MSLTENRIATSEPRIRSRRHARHTRPNWAKRAGVAGGVLSVAALTAAASPASAETTGELPAINEVTQTLDLSQLRAADATAQAAVNYELQAAQDQASADALKAAQAQKAADQARAAAEKAAQQRAAAAKAAAEKAAQQAQSSASSASSAVSSSVSSASGSIAGVISFLEAQVGKPYVYGSTGPDSYDCSGLTQAAFKTIGIDLPRTSQDQSDTGTPVSLSNLQPGDLLFWGGQGSAYHVGVYVGNGNFIAAQNPSEGIVLKPLSYSEPDFATHVA